MQPSLELSGAFRAGLVAAGKSIIKLICKTDLGTVAVASETGPTLIFDGDKFDQPTTELEVGAAGCRALACPIDENALWVGAQGRILRVSFADGDVNFEEVRFPADLGCEAYLVSSISRRPGGPNIFAVACGRYLFVINNKGDILATTDPLSHALTTVNWSSSSPSSSSAAADILVGVTADSLNTWKFIYTDDTNVELSPLFSPLCSGKYGTHLVAPCLSSSPSLSSASASAASEEALLRQNTMIVVATTNPPGVECWDVSHLGGGDDDDTKQPCFVLHGEKNESSVSCLQWGRQYLALGDGPDCMVWDILGMMKMMEEEEGNDNNGTGACDVHIVCCNTNRDSDITALSFQPDDCLWLVVGNDAGQLMLFDTHHFNRRGGVAAPVVSADIRSACRKYGGEEEEEEEEEEGGGGDNKKEQERKQYATAIVWLSQDTLLVGMNTGQLVTFIVKQVPVPTRINIPPPPPVVAVDTPSTMSTTTNSAALSPSPFIKPPPPPPPPPGRPCQSRPQSVAAIPPVFTPTLSSAPLQPSLLPYSADLEELGYRSQAAGGMGISDSTSSSKPFPAAAAATAHHHHHHSNNNNNNNNRQESLPPSPPPPPSMQNQSSGGTINSSTSSSHHHHHYPPPPPPHVARKGTTPPPSRNGNRPISSSNGGGGTTNLMHDTTAVPVTVPGGGGPSPISRPQRGQLSPGLMRHIQQWKDTHAGTMSKAPQQMRQQQQHDGGPSSSLSPQRNTTNNNRAANIPWLNANVGSMMMMPPHPPIGGYGNGVYSGFSVGGIPPITNNNNNAMWMGAMMQFYGAPYSQNTGGGGIPGPHHQQYVASHPHGGMMPFMTPSGGMTMNVLSGDGGNNGDYNMSYVQNPYQQQMAVMQAMYQQQQHMAVGGRGNGIGMMMSPTQQQQQQQQQHYYPSHSQQGQRSVQRSFNFNGVGGGYPSSARGAGSSGGGQEQQQQQQQQQQQGKAGDLVQPSGKVKEHEQDEKEAGTKVEEEKAKYGDDTPSSSPTTAVLQGGHKEEEKTTSSGGNNDKSNTDTLAETKQQQEEEVPPPPPPPPRPATRPPPIAPPVAQQNKGPSHQHPQPPSPPPPPPPQQPPHYHQPQPPTHPNANLITVDSPKTPQESSFSSDFNSASGAGRGGTTPTPTATASVYGSGQSNHSSPHNTTSTTTPTSPPIGGTQSNTAATNSSGTSSRGGEEGGQPTASGGGRGRGGGVAGIDSSSTVYVGNLASNIDEYTLAWTLGFVGPVMRVQIMRDKSTSASKGYGFVTFAHPAYATTAIQQLNNQQMYGPFGGQKLKVATSHQKE